MPWGYAENGVTSCHAPSSPRRPFKSMCGSAAAASSAVPTASAQISPAQNFTFQRTPLP